MYKVFIINKYIAPPAKSKFPVANPNPTVHNGGISAVAIANILHFNKATISGLKKELIKNDFNTRLVNFNK